MSPEHLRSANTLRRIKFRNAVLESKLPAGAKLVALVYESFGGTDMDAVWVTEESLQRRASMSRDTVIRHRKKLVDLGWLVLVTRATPDRCARYRLVVGDGLNLRERASDSATSQDWESDPNSDQNNDQEQCVPPTPDARQICRTDEAVQRPTLVRRQGVLSKDGDAEIEERLAAIGRVADAFQERWDQR